MSSRPLSERDCAHGVTWRITPQASALIFVRSPLGNASSVERLFWCFECGGLSLDGGSSFVAPVYSDASKRARGES